MIKKYVTLIRGGVLEELSYRASLLVGVVFNVVYLAIIYFLWKSIYASSQTEVVNGMTFNDTMIYLVLASALFGIMEMYMVWAMNRDMQNGKIVLDLIKPIAYDMYMFFSMSGATLVSFFTSFLPTFLVVYFVTGGAIHLGINLLYFLISIPLAMIISHNINFAVATICLYTHSTWGINTMKDVVITFLSGVSIPLVFFPETVRNILLMLPFQAIYHTPLNLLLNHNLAFADVFTLLGIQIFWGVATYTFSKIFWNISIKRITVNGG